MVSMWVHLYEHLLYETVMFHEGKDPDEFWTLVSIPATTARVPIARTDRECRTSK